MKLNLLALFLTLITAPAMAADLASTAPTYQITGRISAPDALWDYASLDVATRRLYVGRFGGVMAMDLDTRKITPVLIASQLVHGVVPIPNTMLAASSNGMANTVSIFDGITGRLVATIPTGRGPDGMVIDPKSGLLVVGDGRSDELTLIDTAKRAAVGTIAPGGKPEFLAADGAGHVFNNLENRNEVAVIDIAARKVVHRIKLSGCEGPTGLAYDTPDALLISVCGNGVVKFINAKTYADAATFRIGEGLDAVMLDTIRHVAFVASPVDGTLTVFAIHAATNITVRQTIRTMPKLFIRTGAVDPTNGILYLPTAKVLPPARPGALPSVARGSFVVLVVTPDK